MILVVEDNPDDGASTLRTLKKIISEISLRRT